MPTEDSGAHTQRDGHNPLLRPVCRWKGHQWVPDPFMGDGKECARCGAFDTSFGDEMSELDVYLLGLLTGGFIGGTITWVMFCV